MYKKCALLAISFALYGCSIISTVVDVALLPVKAGVAVIDAVIPDSDSDSDSDD